MDSTLITVLLNTGVAGVVIILILLGFLVPKPYFAKLEQENRHLKEALDAEKQRGTDAENAGRVTNQLITALQQVAAERRGPGPAPPEGEPPGLTWKDLR